MKLRNLIFIAFLTTGLTFGTADAAEPRWPMQLRKAVALSVIFIPIAAFVMAPYKLPAKPLPAGEYTETFPYCHMEDSGRLHCTVYYDTDAAYEWFATLDNADNCALVAVVPGEKGLTWEWGGKNPSLTCAKYKTQPEYWCKEYR